MHTESPTIQVDKYGFPTEFYPEDPYDFEIDAARNLTRELNDKWRAEGRAAFHAGVSRGDTATLWSRYHLEGYDAAASEAAQKPTDTLDAMVAKAVSAWPQIAYRHVHEHGHRNRAEAAADLIRHRRVQRLAESPWSGEDRWEVNGHECSFRGNFCDCGDEYANDEKAGKLCKHRIAAMMAMRLQARKRDVLAAIFACDADEIVLQIRTYYAGRLDEQKTVLTHYRNGDGWHKVDPEFEFSIRQLEAILLETGKEFSAKLNVDRHLGGRERWWFRPTTHSDKDAPHIRSRTDAIFGRDAATAEDQRKRRLGKKWFEQQMDGYDAEAAEMMVEGR